MKKKKMEKKKIYLALSFHWAAPYELSPTLGAALSCRYRTRLTVQLRTAEIDGIVREREGGRARREGGWKWEGGGRR